jgi:hypothetical protein
MTITLTGKARTALAFNEGKPLTQLRFTADKNFSDGETHHPHDYFDSNNEGNLCNLFDRDNKTKNITAREYNLEQRATITINKNPEGCWDILDVQILGPCKFYKGAIITHHDLKNFPDQNRIPKKIKSLMDENEESIKETHGPFDLSLPFPHGPWTTPTGEPEDIIPLKNLKKTNQASQLTLTGKATVTSHKITKEYQCGLPDDKIGKTVRQLIFTADQDFLDGETPQPKNKFATLIHFTSKPILDLDNKTQGIIIEDCNLEYHVTITINKTQKGYWELLNLKTPKPCRFKPDTALTHLNLKNFPDQNRIPKEIKNLMEENEAFMKDSKQTWNLKKRPWDSLALPYGPWFTPTGNPEDLNLCKNLVPINIRLPGT